MEQWIPFREGEYLVERAFLVSLGNRITEMEHAIVEVFLDQRGLRQMNGRGRVENYRVVELMEDSEVLDLLLDFGEGFQFRLPEPTLKSGKFFTPGVKSMMQFLPTAPWQPISADELDNLINCAGDIVGA